MEKYEDIGGVMVRLKIEEEQVLFVLLGGDGSINRLGHGRENETERDFFIGMTDPSVFLDLRDQINDDLLGFCGRVWADPKPVGKLCELTVHFMRADDEDLFTVWKYGAESLGPPPVVRDFVVASVVATNPWFEEQKAMVRTADSGQDSETADE